MKKNIRKIKAQEIKYKICVSGSALIKGVCSPDAAKKTQELGKEIILQGGVLVTGATTGIPYEAAKGAKNAGGLSIGLSPASSEKEHVKKYRLPTDLFDLIIFTGFDYSGRNLLLTRSSDAVIVSCGRMGTLNEFTIAFEDKKPIGVLLGTGGMAKEIKEIVEEARRGPGKIAYDQNPRRLVKKVIRMIEQEKVPEKIKKEISYDTTQG
ncbi:MAG: hypothetical protein ABH837_03330 [bacterium]